MGPSAFIPVHKLWLHGKLSIYNYELCITEYNRVVKLLIRVLFKTYLKMSDTWETFSNFSRQCLYKLANEKRKIIKSGVMFQFTKFENFQNEEHEEEKLNLFLLIISLSFFLHNLKWPQMYNCFLISLLFTKMQHLKNSQK